MYEQVSLRKDRVISGWVLEYGKARAGFALANQGLFISKPAVCCLPNDCFYNSMFFIKLAVSSGSAMFM
jgi:hypothetical protein